MTWQSIIDSTNKYPAKLVSAEGKLLQSIFTLYLEKKDDKSFSKSIYNHYQKEYKGRIYHLTVEYLFRDSDFILDINRAIAINYYLNKGE